MKASILLNGDTRAAVGMIELEDSLMKDLNVMPGQIEITPLITDSAIAAWSLQVVLSNPDALQTETRPDPALSRIQDDSRPITIITFPFQEPGAPSLVIGCELFGREVTKIVPYEEGGEMGYVQWFAIYGRVESDDRADSMRLAQGLTCKIDEIIFRIQAKYVESIGYQEEQPK